MITSTSINSSKIIPDEKKSKSVKRANSSAKSDNSVDAAKLANGVINLPIEMFKLFSGQLYSIYILYLPSITLNN